MILDLFSNLGAGSLTFGTEQIARRQMNISEILFKYELYSFNFKSRLRTGRKKNPLSSTPYLNYFGTLGAFARARST
jgi:hypothetical protein